LLGARGSKVSVALEARSTYSKMVSVTDCWAENSPSDAPWSMIAWRVASRVAASGAMKASSQVVQSARFGSR